MPQKKDVLHFMTSEVRQYPKKTMQTEYVCTDRRTLQSNRFYSWVLAFSEVTVLKDCEYLIVFQIVIYVLFHLIFLSSIIKIARQFKKSNSHLCLHEKYWRFIHLSMNRRFFVLQFIIRKQFCFLSQYLIFFEFFVQISSRSCDFHNFFSFTLLWFWFVGCYW